MKKIRINKNILALTILALILILLPNATSQYNYDHVNVTTRVNVTNAYPEILQVLIDQNITLNAGSHKLVTCNATIRDWNGYDDIETVNATLYHTISSSHEAEDDGNTHYTNSSCVEASNDGEYIADYTCSFNVIYYANNGEWTCNVTVKDKYVPKDFTANLSNTTSVNELYALNVTDLIDYGDLAVTDTSEEENATITNFGNMDINISVLGYGGTDPITGAGLAMTCERGDNITIENQRFSATTGIWDTKTPLSSTDQDLGLTILQATEATAPTTWITFWQLYVPPNPQGLCTGTIRFKAEPAN